MIKRSFDLDLLLRAAKHPMVKSPEEHFRIWFSRPKNLMFADGENVGLATFEYPGMYSLHWFFKVRGRKAINLGKEMIANLFENYGAEVVRGFVRTENKASRWAARQLGLKSMGIIKFSDGEDNEMFCATKAEFLNNLKKDK